MNNRYLAEEYLMKDVIGQDDNKHYCIHHTHHNMQACPTPPSLYVNNPNITLEIRVDRPNCFDRNKTKMKPTKDPRTFCYLDYFPII